MHMATREVYSIRMEMRSARDGSKTTSQFALYMRMKYAIAFAISNYFTYIEVCDTSSVFPRPSTGMRL